MSSALRIFQIGEIERLLDKRDIIAVVREALVQHSRGNVRSPMPGQLSFPDAHGDCHIKFGHITGSPTFAVKIATGFYRNAKLGLPSANGLTLLFDATTGAPRCLFQDAGMLTAWRTAAATALAAHCLSPVPAPVVGIIGTGLQAQLTPSWVAQLLPQARFIMHGRDPVRTAKVATACGASVAGSCNELLNSADIVITATPAVAPLFAAAQVRAGQHFVALGADGPEKQELPVELFAQADHVVTDDHAQCLSFGEFGKAVTAGVVSADIDIALGSLLADDIKITRRPSDVSILDLTGLAAQDIAIASWFAGALETLATP